VSFSCLLPLTLNAGLFIVFMAAHFSPNTLLLHLFVKPFKQTFEALILAGYYLSHIASTPFSSTDMKRKCNKQSHFSGHKLPCQGREDKSCPQALYNPLASAVKEYILMKFKCRFYGQLMLED